VDLTSSPPPSPRVVRVHVDELRLEGIDPRLRYRVADAMERELARLFTETRDDEDEGAVAGADRIDAGLVTLAEGAPAEQVGIAIARAAYRGMRAGGR
jgi:hypothetical protein